MEGNFKARCIYVNNGYESYYTKSKIYNIEKGIFIRDDGRITGSISPISDVDDLNGRIAAVFELVGEHEPTEIDPEKFVTNYHLQKATDTELLTEFERRLKK